MKVLLVGGGGREHALAWKISQSPLCDQLFLAPGNPMSADLGVAVDIPATDIVALKYYVKKEGIDLTVSLVLKLLWWMVLSINLKQKV